MKTIRIRAGSPAVLVVLALVFLAAFYPAFRRSNSIRQLVDTLSSVENCQYFEDYLNDMSELLADGQVDADAMERMDQELYNKFFSKSLSYPAFQDAVKNRFFTTYSFYLLNQYQLKLEERQSMEFSTQKISKDEFAVEADISYLTSSGESIRTRRSFLLRFQDAPTISYLQITEIQNDLPANYPA